MSTATLAPPLATVDDAPVLAMAEFLPERLASVKALVRAAVLVSNGQVRLFNPNRRLPWPTRPWFIVESAESGAWVAPVGTKVPSAVGAPPAPWVKILPASSKVVWSGELADALHYLWGRKIITVGDVS